MQAVSGAGYPGVPSLDILGNVVPFIGGEEEKMQSETQKILGGDGGRAPHAVRISAHTNRVPVIDGHTITVSVEFSAVAGRRGGGRGAALVPRPAAGAGPADRPVPGHRGDGSSPTARSRGSTPSAATA